MAELKISNEVVQKAVATSLMEQLGQDGQAKLVEAALEYLITPKPSPSYGSKVEHSPLQEMFEQAVGVEARKIVADLVAKDEGFQERIKRQVGEAFIQMESEQYTYYLGQALGDALRKG